MRAKIIRAVLALILVPTVAMGGEWYGPELVVNGEFRNGSYASHAGWTEYPLESWTGGTYYNPGPGIVTGILSQSLAFTAGKRYSASGYMQAGKYTEISSYKCRFDTSFGTTGWSTNTTKSKYTFEGIWNGGTSNKIELKAVLFRSGVGNAHFDNMSVKQVVYDPQLSFGKHVLRLNTVPGTSSANAELGLASLSCADAPTSWQVNWGDGTSANNPMLDGSASHQYTISGGNSQTWTASFSGSNQAGSDSDSALVTLLLSPTARLRVNGQSVTSGAVVNVTPGDSLSLSLADSSGFIESAAFEIPGRVESYGTNLSYAGSVFNSYDIGNKFSLAAWVENTGEGMYYDYMTVDLLVVPEPASLSLFALGGLAIFRRKGQNKCTDGGTL